MVRVQLPEPNNIVQKFCARAARLGWQFGKYYKWFSKSYYVDARFKGSASIKNVLPVLVPELTYKNLNICKGDQASERWEKMVLGNVSAEEKEQIKQDLLEYCKLDTWAMVKIYQFLKSL